jgi:iron complex transport system substrate-binding protein
MKRTITYILLVATTILGACNTNNQERNATADTATIPVNEQTRIVSLNGSVTEALCALGLEPYIKAVDVTSTYPESMYQLPKVGHNRNLSAELILTHKPTIVIGTKEFVKPELIEQLSGAGVPLITYNIEHSVESGKALIRKLADTFGMPEKATAVIEAIDHDIQQIQKPPQAPKVLFIYARGAGTLLAAGEGTAPHTMIRLAGGTNAAEGFSDFKPLTAEALVKANPDVILMFDDGLTSVGGMDGLLQIQGIRETNAGKNKQVIEMEGLFLTGFGPRTGKALDFLSKKLNEVPAR